MVRGAREAQEQSPLDPGRTRKAMLDPTMKEALEWLVEPLSRGDPDSPLRWRSKSTRVLAGALKAKGYSVSHVLVADLLHEMEYSLQANRKTMEGADRPDRDGHSRSSMESSAGKSDILKMGAYQIESDLFKSASAALCRSGR